MTLWYTILKGLEWLFIASSGFCHPPFQVKPCQIPKPKKNKKNWASGKMIFTPSMPRFTLQSGVSSLIPKDSKGRTRHSLSASQAYIPGKAGSLLDFKMTTLDLRLLTQVSFCHLPSHLHATATPVVTCTHPTVWETGSDPAKPLL